jgi:PIN domain nuclease of toxin-antitoxin system
MKLLLDSHIVLAVVHNDIARYGHRIAGVLERPDTEIFVSSASLWEIAIKYRTGKLELQVPLERIPGYLQSLKYRLIAIDERHAIETLDQAPGTRDPFDRMLLAQCQVEGLRLITIDRALVAHPLAWRAP